MAAVNVPVLDEYFEAFHMRDVARCLAAYGENAILEFGGTYCQDKACLERWHQERFASNLSVLRIEHVTIDGATVTVEGVVSSDRLRTWGVQPVAGQAVFIVRDGKIADARFGLQARRA